MVIGQWYKFDDYDTKSKAVDSMFELCNKYGEEPLHDKEFYMAKEVLCVFKCLDGHFTIRYRTRYNSMYDKETILFTLKQEDNKNMENKENKDMEYVKERIKQRRAEAERELELKYIAKRQDYIKNTEAGKAMFLALDTIKVAHGGKFDYNLMDYIEPCMYTEKEICELKQIDAEYEKICKETTDFYRDLIALMSITDTYEQKRDLLFTYNIIGEIR